MGGSAPSAPAVSVPPPIPAIQSPQGIQAANIASMRATQASGPAAMQVTGPNGLSSPATTSVKSLLGG